MGSISGSERSSGGGHGNALQYSCLENPHQQRGQVGYSLWGCKELDTTEATEPACILKKNSLKKYWCNPWNDLLPWKECLSQKRLEIAGRACCVFSLIVSYISEYIDNSIMWLLRAPWRRQMAWVQILIWPLPSWVTLSEFANFYFSISSSEKHG